jgi:hypothetical protein
MLLTALWIWIWLLTLELGCWKFSEKNYVFVAKIVFMTILSCIVMWTQFIFNSGPDFDSTLTCLAFLINERRCITVVRQIRTSSDSCSTNEQIVFLAIRCLHFYGTYMQLFYFYEPHTKRLDGHLGPPNFLRYVYLGLFPRGESGRGVNITAQLNLALRLRMNGAVFPHLAQKELYSYERS